MERNYVNQWTPYIKKYVRVAKTNITPLNIYKIQTYRYVDGVVRRKVGIETNLVFVIGVHLREIHCIRLNPITFTHFFTWSRKFKKSNINESIDDSKTEIKFSEILQEFNENGLEFFNRYVKNTPTIYSNELDSYRTYKVNNIIYAQEVLMDSKKIKNIYG